MWLISLVLLLWTGCDIPPRYVSQSDVGDAFIQERYKTVCKGLEMSEDETRKYAAEKLASLKQPLARDCICENIETPEGSWDPAIAKGLVSTRFPEVVECFTRLVERPDLPDRLEAVVVLKGINTSNARDTLAKVVRGEGDDEVRAKAMEGISGNSQYQELFLELLASPTETPAVRAAAAKAMAGLKAKLVASTLTRAATEDAEPEVRGAALGALRSAGAKGVDELICKSMMEDESPLVRRKAVLAFKGTKRSGPVACLRDRALTLEEDAGVRDALLTVLKSSPSDDAAKILCDAIPFWMRSYVVEEIPEKLPGTEIVPAQNDRDYERSYECVERAYRNRSGYSCFATMHLAIWFRELGGSSYVPNCPGYENEKLKELMGK